jgi:Zn-dependent protease
MEGDLRSQLARQCVSTLLERWDEPLPEEERRLLREELIDRGVRVPADAPPPPQPRPTRAETASVVPPPGPEGRTARERRPRATNAEILERIRSGRHRAGGSAGAWLLLAVSLGLFTGAGAVVWSPAFVALLVLALFVHECGHLLAMRLYRYKNLKMLFLPLLGAAAMGTPDEHDAYKIAVISLAGPLVGIASSAFAALVFALTGSEIVLDYAWLALALNAFNLLPLLPLDGGHCLNELVFERHPKAYLAFLLLGAAGLAWLALAAGSIVLGVIALFALLSVPYSYRLARVRNRLRADPSLRGGELTEERVARIRAELAKASPGGEESPGRLHHLVEATWKRIDKRFPSAPCTAGLLVSYVVILLLMVPAGAVLLTLVAPSG